MGAGGRFRTPHGRANSRMVSDSKGKKHIWRGLGLLGLGSALLLCTKFNPSPLWDSLLCFGGGGMLLYANGEFLFGLLIHANAVEPAPSDTEPAPDSQQSKE